MSVAFVAFSFLAVWALGPAAPTPSPLPAAAPSVVSPAELPVLEGALHEHRWVKESKRVWVPAEYRDVRIGTDEKGKPIYERRLVKGTGTYKVKYVTKCTVCGRTKE